MEESHMLPIKIRIWSFVLCAVMLISLAACSGTDPKESASTTAENEEAVTTNPDFSVEDLGDSTRVDLEGGLSYTVSGYDSSSSHTFDFVNGLTVDFGEAFTENFNRFILSYRATAPMRFVVTYQTGSGKTVESDYYLEAGEGEFSGLTDTYLEGKRSINLTRIVVDTCKDERASFTLLNLKTEMAEVYSDTCFIQNEKFKLGIDLGWGGTVNYLEDLTAGVEGLTNLVNKHDTGRLIQQSYYGTGAIEGVFEWGSFRESEEWPYNPVQGGDRGNVASRLVDVEVGDNYIYIKSQPMDWGKVGYRTPSYMENKYILEEDYVRVDNRFVDFSGWEHPYEGQELPALYTVSYLDTFVWYGGRAPWTGDALSYRDDLGFWGGSQFFPLYENNTETWCAWVNTDIDFGIGLYVPNVDRHKAGRYEYNGTMDANGNPTNYVAPYNTIKIVSFEALEYSYLLTTGSIEQIRETFTENKDFSANETLHHNYVSNRLPDLAVDMTDIDLTAENNYKVFSSLNSASASYDATEKTTKLTVDGSDPFIYLNFALWNSECLAEDYERVEIVYMVPATNSDVANYSRLFTCTGEQVSATGSMAVGGKLTVDGEYHTLSYNVSSYNFWAGKINQLRFDFFENAEKGDVMFLKSIKLIKKPENLKIEGTAIDFSKEENVVAIDNPRNTVIAYDASRQAAKLTVTDPNDVHVAISFAMLAEKADATQYPKLKMTYMIPSSGESGETECDLFLCAGEVTAPVGTQRIRVKLIADGEYHTLEVDLSEKNYWKGTVNLIRLDYFDACASGDVFYLKSIELAK